MALRLPGDKPLSEPIMVKLLTYICITRHQWDKVAVIQTKMELGLRFIFVIYHRFAFSCFIFLFYSQTPTILLARGTLSTVWYLTWSITMPHCLVQPPKRTVTSSASWRETISMRSSMRTITQPACWCCTHYRFIICHQNTNKRIKCSIKKHIMALLHWSPDHMVDIMQTAFPIHFLVWKSLYCDSNLIGNCFQLFNQQ